MDWTQRTKCSMIFLDFSLIRSTLSGNGHNVYLAHDLYDQSSFFPITLERWLFWQKPKEHFSSAVFKVPSKDEIEAKKPLRNGKSYLLSVGHSVEAVGRKGECRLSQWLCSKYARDRTWLHTVLLVWFCTSHFVSLSLFLFSLIYNRVIIATPTVVSTVWCMDLSNHCCLSETNIVCQLHCK